MARNSKLAPAQIASVSCTKVLKKAKGLGWVIEEAEGLGWVIEKAKGLGWVIEKAEGLGWVIEKAEGLGWVIELTLSLVSKTTILVLGGMML